MLILSNQNIKPYLCLKSTDWHKKIEKDKKITGIVRRCVNSYAITEYKNIIVHEDEKNKWFDANAWIRRKEKYRKYMRNTTLFMYCLRQCYYYLFHYKEWVGNFDRADSTIFESIDRKQRDNTTKKPEVIVCDTEKKL